MTEAMSYKVLATFGGTAIEFLSAGISGGYDLIDDEDGIRGTRSRTLERAVQGNLRLAGDLKLNPTPVELAAIWPFCVNSSTAALLTDAMQDVTAVVDLITKKNTYVGRVGKVTLAGSPGKKLDLTVGFVGKSIAEAATSLNGVPDITVRPYMFYDSGSGITIGGSTFAFDQFELEIDNHIEPTFMNGQTPTDLEPTDRTVRLKVRTKYNAAEAALQTLAATGPVLGSPVTGSLAFTNGSNSVTFTFGALVAEPKTVTAQRRQDKLRWDGVFHALKVGTTLEVVTVFV